MKQKYYLEGLTSIRFILASLVVLAHCNQNLMQYNINWFSEIPLLHKGGFAVDAFFILSGFLLTHLAYIEYKTFNSINFRLFFIRRILRIFPLYYLVVFLGYLTLGIIYPILMQENYLGFSILEGLPYHLMFLPNWISAKYVDNVGSFYSLWTIGVEEQYYIFFPFICSLVFKKKKPALWFFGIALFYLMFYKLIQWNYPSSWIVDFKHFLSSLKFHFMLLGGAFALLFQKYKYEIRQFLSFKLLQVGMLTMFVLLISTDLLAKYEIIYGSIFCVFLISITDKQTSILNMENMYLKYLGTISFGIYVYHPLISYPLRYVLNMNSVSLDLVTSFPALYYGTELILTILIAHFSYKFYEIKFLRMKKKYTTIT